MCMFFCVVDVFVANKHGNQNAKQFVTWPPFIIVYRSEKRWPSDKANHTCENML